MNEFALQRSIWAEGANRLGRIAQLDPSHNAARQWEDAADAVLFQQERYTSARRFAGSRAIQHDIVVAWYLIVALGHLVQRDAR